MNDQVQRDGEFIGLPLNIHMAQLIKAMFLKMPHLSFVASKRGMGEISEIKKVLVYQGSNHLGYIGWTHRHTNSGGEYKYTIMSHNICNERGDRHIKYTSKVDSAVRLAKQYFLARSDDETVKRAVDGFDNHFRQLTWPLDSKYQDFAGKHGLTMLKYMYSVSQGETPTIDTSLLQELNSEAFKKLYEDRRITRRVHANFDKRNGVLIRLLRDESLSVLDIASNKITKIKSTYDLPKNFQEKLAILKVMGKNTPIDNVGVSFEMVIDDGVTELVYFLIHGETLMQ
jgi:hypothetical protein